LSFRFVTYYMLIGMVFSLCALWAYNMTSDKNDPQTSLLNTNEGFAAVFCVLTVSWPYYFSLFIIQIIEMISND
jgi:hypothetical protein